MADRDMYGGWTGKQFEATGYFRLEREDQKWWLVTPEGNAYVSYGINHYHQYWWDQDYNRDHWLSTFGSSTFGDDAWKAGYRKMVSEDLKHIGLNALGIHTDSVAHEPTPLAPYMARYEPVEIPHYKEVPAEMFHDIFSSEFDDLCDAKAREQVKPKRDDPFVLGYSMTDCPIFTDQDAQERTMTVYGAPRKELQTWPKLLRNRDAASAGKQAYVACMIERYGDVTAFNGTYDTSFATWDELREAVNWRPKTDYANTTEIQDNAAFLRICVDTYYRKAKEALRRYDTNHLFFGDKLNANSDGLETVIDITCTYTDLVFYQMYARYDEQVPVLNLINSVTDKAILNGDSAYSTVTDMIPDPYGPHADSQEQRAEWTREFVEHAYKRPEFVGWHMCGTIDTWKTMPGKDGKQHTGLKDPTGTYYPVMEAVAREISRMIYDLHAG